MHTHGENVLYIRGKAYKAFTVSQSVELVGTTQLVELKLQLQYTHILFAIQKNTWSKGTFKKDKYIGFHIGRHNL